MRVVTTWPRSSSRSCRRTAARGQVPRAQNARRRPDRQRRQAHGLAAAADLRSRGGDAARWRATSVRRPRPSAALFGYTKLYGQVPGAQAEYLNVPFGHTLPIRSLRAHPRDRPRPRRHGHTRGRLQGAGPRRSRRHRLGAGGRPAGAGTRLRARGRVEPIRELAMPTSQCEARDVPGRCGFDRPGGLDARLGCGRRVAARRFAHRPSARATRRSSLV